MNLLSEGGIWMGGRKGGNRFWRTGMGMGRGGSCRVWESWGCGGRQEIRIALLRRQNAILYAIYSCTVHNYLKMDEGGVVFDSVLSIIPICLIQESQIYPS